MIESELVWESDHVLPTVNPHFRWHSQLLAPLNGAQFPYRHPTYRIIKHHSHREQRTWFSVRYHIAHMEQPLSDEFELALFIAELTPGGNSA
jgi:hypothetical protein